MEVVIVSTRHMAVVNVLIARERLIAFAWFVWTVKMKASLRGEVSRAQLRPVHMLAQTQLYGTLFKSGNRL